MRSANCRRGLPGPTPGPTGPDPGLQATLHIFSGAVYLDMIWYGVSLKSIPEIFWSTICDIDEAADNIIFPSVSVGRMKLFNDWGKKCKNHHAFTTNMGTSLAVDGFVIVVKKPNASDLDGQQVDSYRNHKIFWALISPVACDSNAKVQFIQTDWPGAINGLSCFRETPLYLLL